MGDRLFRWLGDVGDNDGEVEELEAEEAGEEGISATPSIRSKSSAPQLLMAIKSPKVEVLIVRPV